MKIRYLILILVLLQSSVCAANWERRWVCDDVLHTKPSKRDNALLLFKQGDRGLIRFDGIEVHTDFRVNGLSRFWLWGLGELGEPDVYRYYLRLDESTWARYYDFSNANEKERRSR